MEIHYQVRLMHQDGKYQIGYCNKYYLLYKVLDLSSSPVDIESLERSFHCIFHMEASNNAHVLQYQFILKKKLLKSGPPKVIAALREVPAISFHLPSVPEQLLV